MVFISKKGKIGIFFRKMRIFPIAEMPYFCGM